MKRILALSGVILAAQILMAGVASASYNPQNDINLNLNAPVKLPAVQTGSLTFGLQEAVHQTVSGLTGTSVDHSYIWISVNGQSVAAIDPPKAYVRG